MAARVLRLAAGLQWGVALLVFAAALTPYPAWDMFSWIAAWFAARRDGAWLAYLWAPHNEHRLPLIRLLVGADATWCGGRGIVLIGAAALAVPAMAWMA
ncbi:MAG TPA: hypothetical protein VMB71_08440, partial [Acetobacteraceae bacterium]|nr:hypothetical protein [Acetobacteraceae bacterium]